jgi:plastocyanin
MRLHFGKSLSTAAALGLLSCGHALAASPGAVAVVVTDQNGEPVPDVVVVALPPEPLSLPAPETIAVMDQIDTAFVPHILVVQTGTHVSFPNHDTVSHHVYSFSQTKPFQLDLYRGNSHPPQVFDAPGLVVLGCNIHDSMLGYIYVTDSPFFATTDNTGTARMSGLPEGAYTVEVWTPRAQPKDLPGPSSIHIGSSAVDLAVQFTGKLRPPHDAHSGSLSWDHY